MKCRNVIIAILATLTLFTGVVSTATAAVEVEGDVYAGASSMYLWRGFDLSNSDPVVQGGLDVGFKGLTFSYWSNLDLNSGEINETDVTIDYGYALNDLVAVNVGNIFYSLEGAKDTNELYLGVSLNTILSPTFTLYYDYDEAKETGLFYTFSISHDLSLSEDLTLSLGGLVSYNQESDYAVGSYSDWHDYELSATVDYALTDQLSLSPYAVYSDAISTEAEKVIKDEFVTGLNLTFSF